MRKLFFIVVCVIANLSTMAIAQNSVSSIVGEWCYRQEWQDEGHTNFCNWVYVFTSDGNAECRKELGTKGMNNGYGVVEIWGDQERISSWKNKPEIGISSVECFFSLQYGYDKEAKIIDLNWHGEPRAKLKVISFTDDKLTIDEDGEIITYNRRSYRGELHFKY